MTRSSKNSDQLYVGTCMVPSRVPTNCGTFTSDERATVLAMFYSSIALPAQNTSLVQTYCARLSRMKGLFHCVDHRASSTYSNILLYHESVLILPCAVITMCMD